MNESLGTGRRRLGAWAAIAAGTVSTCALAQSHPGFEGTWSGVFTTQDNEFWQIEDWSCFAGCPKEIRDHLTALLDDPANKEKPLDELTNSLFPLMREHLTKKLTPKGLELQNAGTPANDPTLDCQPYGYFREAINPLPVVIRRDGDNLVFQYEEWEKTRTIYMDGRGHPKTLTPTDMGHSVGHYEGDALVVDTVALKGDIFYSFLSGGAYSDQAHGHERYTIAENPRRLNLDITIEDPVTLREPYTVSKTWIYTPDVKLVVDSCTDYPTKP